MVTFSPSQSNVVTVTVTAPPPAEVATTLTLTGPTSAQVGETKTYTGRLTRNDTGAGIPSMTITLYVNNTAQSSTTTDSSGNYSFNVTFSSAGSYSLQTKFAGATV
jgi:hypothetical protein